MTWLGIDNSLPSILLNSHMDVVPVFEQHWTHPPFAAEIDENGNIYGRGTQDMKSVGMQYLEAIKVLKDQGIRLKRTVHVVYVPGNCSFIFWCALSRLGFSNDNKSVASSEILFSSLVTYLHVQQMALVAFGT